MTWATIFGVASLSVAVAGCDGSALDDPIIDGQPAFWQEADAFAESEGSYLNVNVYTDRERGHYLEMQFQCYRDTSADMLSEFNILINSRSEDFDTIYDPPMIDAVLYKIDGQSARLYRDDYDNRPRTLFRNTTLNGAKIFYPDAEGNMPKRVSFRFVTGANAMDVRMGKIDALSRSEATDLTIDASDPQVDMFLRACSPEGFRL
ncbi:hypothetical protein DVR09_16360 (plasmid) [Erythrobacter aureus]|uniref:Uncharacterized protein n=2 Tax=Erythrobacter aureus TaxID=2182384 RepID=A0A345YJC3_9SPHN|nr:hypothetical protein DVR09_16360 [Erythrobacter aureus]